MTTNLIQVNKVACIAWQLVKNGTLLNKQLTYESLISVERAGLPYKGVLSIEMHSDGAFYLNKYPTTDLSAVISSMVLEDGDYLYGIDTLYSQLEGIGDESFRQAYTADYVDALIQSDHHGQYKPKSFKAHYTIGAAMGLLFDFKIAGNKHQSWHPVLGDDPGNLLPVAYSGWDGNQMLLLLQGEDAIYKLAYYWS